MSKHRENWLQYVKDNIDSSTMVNIAAHIDVKPRQLRRWMGEWRTQGVLPPLSWYAWETHKDSIVQNAPNMTVNELAIHIGMPRTTLSRCLKLNNIVTKEYKKPVKQKKERQPRIETRTKWLSYIKDNIDQDRIKLAKHIGISKNTLKEWIRDYRDKGLVEDLVDWEQYKEYVQEHLGKMPLVKIAENLNVAYHSLHKRVKGWGMPIRVYKDNNKWKEYIVAHMDTSTIQEIAEHTGHTGGTIWRWIKEWKDDGEIKGRKITESYTKYTQYILDNANILSADAMAAHAGVTPKTMTTWIEKVTGAPKKRVTRYVYNRETRECKPKKVKPDRVLKKLIEEAKRKKAAENAPKKVITPVLLIRIKDESQYRYIQVDVRTKIQIPIEMNKEEAIEKWNSKYKKAI